MGHLQSTSYRGPVAAPLPARADIVFCVDVTGSMQPCLDQVCEHIDSFICGIDPTVDVRFRLIAYRDLVEEVQTNDPWPVVTDFIDAAAFRTELSKLEPRGGGGHSGESTLDAIYRAIRSPWRRREGDRPGPHKAIIVITDDEPHPRLDQSTYPRPDGDASTVIQEFMKLDHSLLYLIAPEHEIYAKLIDAARNYRRSDQHIFHHTVLSNELENAEVYWTNIEWRSLLESLARQVSESSFAASRRRGRPA